MPLIKTAYAVKDPSFFSPYYDETDVDKNGRVHVTKENAERFRKHGIGNALAGTAILSLPIVKMVRHRPVDWYDFANIGLGGAVALKGVRDMFVGDEGVNSIFTAQRRRNKKLKEFLGIKG